MVLVSCSYVPFEIPLALGMPVKRAVFHETGESCDVYLPRDFCPYARAFARDRGHDGVVAIAGSCDAMRRAYDALRYFGLSGGVHFVDVPRTCTHGSEEYYAAVLRDFALQLAHAERSGAPAGWASMENVDGDSFRRRLVHAASSMNLLRSGLSSLFRLVGEGRLSAAAAVAAALRANDALGTAVEEGPCESARDPKGGRTAEPTDPADTAAVTRALRAAGIAGTPGAESVGATERESSGGLHAGGKPRVGVTGTCLLEPALLTVIEDSGLAVAFVDSCIGLRCFDFRVELEDGVGDPFHELARAYLRKPPCPRMFAGDVRVERLRRLALSHGVHGIVYFAPKFCDYAYYDFAEMKRHVGEGDGVPMLLLETEYGSAGSGQILTRITAFREMLEGRLGRG
ncbi:MAG: 2-hydroxyacyl-CoA dehydratase [Betaproteobacteria bacterium]